FRRKSPRASDRKAKSGFRSDAPSMIRIVLWASEGTHGDLSARCGFGGSEGGYGLDDAVGGLVAPFRIDELRLVFRVGQIPKLDQHRRHVGRAQNLETGEAVRVVDQPDRRGEFPDERIREAHRKG